MNDGKHEQKMMHCNIKNKYKLLNTRQDISAYQRKQWKKMFKKKISFSGIRTCTTITFYIHGPTSQPTELSRLMVQVYGLVDYMQIIRFSVTKRRLDLLYNKSIIQSINFLTGHDKINNFDYLN